MFESIEEKEPEEQEDTNYAGVIIGVVLIPVYFLFKYLGGPDIGLSASVALGMIIFAVGLRWELRTQTWFWLTIAAALLIHVPVIMKLRWHIAINRMSLLPIGLIDLLFNLALIKVVEKFIVRYQAPDAVEQPD